MKKSESPNEEPITFITPRHTKKVKQPGQGSSSSGEFYSGITEEGERIVREKTKEQILEIVEKCQPGSVIIFGGATDLIRTKSSSRVSGNELKKILQERQSEFLILDEKDINSLVSNRRTESTLHALSKIVEQNKNKKIIIIYPLFIQELSMVKKEKGRGAGKDEWRFKDESLTPYSVEMIRRFGDEEVPLLAEWIKNQGKTQTPQGETVKGPNAQEVAKEYIQALKRLEKVSRKLFPKRPLVIEATGHSWDLDAFITYAAKGGEVTPEGFMEIAKGDQENPTIIREFEFPIINIGKEAKTITYHGKTYPITAPEFQND